VLDVSLEGISAGILRDVTVTFPRIAHTAITGPPASGASTLLGVIAGRIRPRSGTVRIGAHDVTHMRGARRPLLYVTSRIDTPHRWSVQHVLIAALRTRNFDRDDRLREYRLVAEKWKLTPIARRPLRTLSSTEQTIVHLARIELLRPAILVADRLLERANPSVLFDLADEFFRSLRVIGTTTISAPASAAELGLTDRVVVLEEGSIVQEGPWPEVYRHPRSAGAGGEINVIPVTIRGGVVESPIGSWTLPHPLFEGAGTALVRPEDFHVAAPGEESDLIFGIEEASFREGHWLATGILADRTLLRVWLDGDFAVAKGRLLPLRFDPQRVTILQGTVRPLQLPPWFGISLG